MYESATIDQERCYGGVTIYLNGRIRVQSIHLGTDGYICDAHDDIEFCNRKKVGGHFDGVLIPPVVDAHVHVLEGFGIGAAPDEVGAMRSVSTVYDAGSAGAATLPALMRLAALCRTRVFSWLNISAVGIIDARLSEYNNMELVNVEEILEATANASGFVIGFKARLSRKVVGDETSSVLNVLDALRDATKLPCTVHVGATSVPFEAILDRLAPGDVVAHAFHGLDEGLLVDGQVAPWAWRAKNRGILFDIAPGDRHLSWPVLQNCAAEGFWPDLISSDVTRPRVTDDGSRMEVIASGVLAAGVPLEQVVKCMTDSPARIAHIALTDPKAVPWPPLLLRHLATISEQEIDIGGSRVRLSRQLTLDSNPLAKSIPRE
jgi:dihydroorotase